MHVPTVVWMAESLLSECVHEADQYYDLEAGGALMGYWHNAVTMVVTASIDAGPEARHERYNFEPDQDWQLTEIARHYEVSGRRETYVGDWHTHPNAKSSRLSWTDKSVLRRIVNSPAARAPRPLMLLFNGSAGNWLVTPWLAHLMVRPILWPKLVLEEGRLEVY